MRHAMIGGACKIVEIGAGAAVVVLLEKYYPHLPVGLSVMVGILTAVVFLQVDAFVTSHIHHMGIQATLERHYADHRQMLATLASSLAEESSERALAQLGVRYSGQEIDEKDAPAVWKDLTCGVQHSYDATNYISIPHLYENEFAEKVVSVQKAKVRAQNVRMRKVFICDNWNELSSDSGRKLIENHQAEDANIRVRCILRNDIATKPVLPGHLSAIGQDNLDFAIFDSRVVMVWALNAKREIKSARVYVDKTLVAKFEECFNALFDAATNPPA